MKLSERLYWYYRLIRMDKPVGTFLLLWPTLIALWLASGGVPELKMLVIFCAGTFLMRSAGCAVNDYADRDFDKFVKRTADRPITSGKISGKEALGVAALLALSAFLLILPLNALTKQLSVVALFIAASYPFFKRFFAMPQAYLGIAFGFGIPMSFAAVSDAIPLAAWVLLLGNVFWAIAYDTAYAMVDRDDDLKIGIKTSAITLGRFDVAGIMICYALFFGLTAYVASVFQRGWICYVGILGAAIFAVYHYSLIRTRDRLQCFKVFRQNNALGAIVFAGFALDYFFAS